jgi:hypothetical protein
VSSLWLRFCFWLYLAFLLWAAATITNPADPDLWHRLAVGEYLERTGHFPVGDTFSYLADYQKIADHEWGSAVIFYSLWQWGAGTAIVVTKLVTLAVTLALIVWAGIRTRRPTAWIVAFYSLVLLTLLPSFQSTVRCMVFTHVFFALWLCWYQRERYGGKVFSWLYVLTMIVWANLHGGFVIGLAWLFLLAIIGLIRGGDWVKWAARFGLCTAATLINPFGWRLWISTGRALVTTRKGFNEWAPLSWFSDPLNYPGFRLLVVGVVIAIGIQIYRKGWRQLDRTSLILIGTFLLIGLTSARQTSYFALVAGALVPDIFPFKWPYDLRHRPLRRLVAVGVNFGLVIVPFFAALIILPQGQRLRLEYPDVACPTGGVAFLKSRDVRGKLLVPFNYGSYALWELRDRMKVSMDGRYDLVYRPETYRRVEGFFAGKADGWDLLISPKPDAILVRRDDGVYPRLQADAGWAEAWNDSVDAVFLPRGR